MRLKKLLSFFLAAIMLVSTCAVSAIVFAESENESLGAEAACTGNIHGIFSGVPACVNKNGELHICKNNFPDDHFRKYLANRLGFAENSYITDNEVQAITEISIPEIDPENYDDALVIHSLQGVEFFTALTSLDCFINQITTLNISNNPRLTSLICFSNQLSTLDVSNNPELTYLDCSANELTELDVNNNLKLTNLYCYANKLTELNVNNNPELVSLDCSYNKLTKLDVNNNPELTSISCYGNQLTALNVNNNIKLSFLSCYSNPLTSLDVRSNPELEYLACSNITKLDLSKNLKLTELYCNNCRLSTLDISKNSKLTALDCSGNQLTALDISNNPELTNIACETQYVSLEASLDENKVCTLDLSDVIPKKYFDDVTLVSEYAKYDSINGVITLVNPKSFVSSSVDYDFAVKNSKHETIGKMDIHITVSNISEILEKMGESVTEPNKEYTKGSSVGVTIHCSYDMNDFVSVAIDGETVDPENYTLSEGSTILTFKPSYLNTLPVGEHTVTLNYINATAASFLTIKAAQEETTVVPDEPTTDSNEQTTSNAETENTTGLNNVTGSAVNSATNNSTKSPSTGASYAGIAAAAGAAVLSGAALIFLKKKK